MKLVMLRPHQLLHIGCESCQDKLMWMPKFKQRLVLRYCDELLFTWMGDQLGSSYPVENLVQCKGGLTRK